MNRDELFEFIQDINEIACKPRSGPWDVAFTDALIASGATITLPEKPKTYTVTLNESERSTISAALHNTAYSCASLTNEQRDRYLRVRQMINGTEADK